MANILLHLSNNTRDPSLSAYRVVLASTDDTVRPFRQIGPVYNDTVIYEGVFHGRPEAVACATRYIATPHRLVDYQDMLTGDHRTAVERYDRKPASLLGVHRRVLAAASPSGTFTAA